VIYNYSTTQLYVSRFPGTSAVKYDFTVPPLSNRQWGWSGPISTLYVFNPGPGSADINLTSYVADFDPAAVAQSGQNVVIANSLNVASMPAVTIANAVLPVSGNVGITGTVNTNITSGTVNATIQNASIDTEITNAMLSTTNMFSQPVKSIAINLIAGASVTVDIPLDKLILTDELFIYAYSLGLHSDKLQYTMNLIANSILPYSHTYAFSPLVDINGSPGNAYTQILKSNISPAFPTSQIRMTIKNIGSTTLVESINFYINLKFTGSTITNTSTSPVNIKGISNTMTGFNKTGVVTNSIIIPSGGLLNTLVFTVTDGGPGGGVNLFNNGQMFWSTNLTSGQSKEVTLDFKNGVPNNGIGVTLSNLVSITGYGVQS